MRISDWSSDVCSSDLAPIVRATVGAIKAIGLTPDVFASSTDSNIAMSIGIPAVTVGYGGDGGRSHSLDEFIDVEKTRGVREMSVGLLALLGAAEIEQIGRAHV